MSDKRRLSFLLLSLAATLFGTRLAHACSCGPKPTVLDAYDRADFVVVTRVVSVEKSEKAAPEGRIGDAEHYVDGVKSTIMRVERVYKGGLKIGDEMTFAQGGGADCIWTFNEKSVGQQYLFYLMSPPRGQKVWIGFGCGRSSGLQYAADDLLYLNKFEIGLGDFVENVQIHAPKSEETITVEGVFLYSDGKPVSKERVEFKAAKTDGNIEGDAIAQTDGKGRFRIKILKGLQGELYGGMYTYEGEFENCPKLDAIIKKGGENMPEIKTTALKIQAEGDLYNVELKYPFPGCKKAKN